MKNIISTNKTKLQHWTMLLGFLCMFFGVLNQNQKSYIHISQELIFWVTIAGIVFLSIGINLKIQTKDEENLNFLKRNSPLIWGLSAALLLIIFWVANNYILF